MRACAATVLTNTLTTRKECSAALRFVVVGRSLLGNPRACGRVEMHCDYLKDTKQKKTLLFLFAKFSQEGLGLGKGWGGR